MTNATDQLIVFATSYGLKIHRCNHNFNPGQLCSRPWVKKEDYWQLKLDLTLKIKEAFEANGIELPFPQRAVHIVSRSS